MNKVKIKAVIPLFEDGQAIHITWEDGKKSTVKLAGVIARHQGMQPLMDEAIFNTVQVADWGWAIAWGDTIDMGTARLRELADEQQKQYRQTFQQWRRNHALTYDKAAIALGISRRSIGLYENGKQPVPKHIALACKGWDAEHH